MYKFLVTFVDESTKIVTAEENTALYNKLASFIKNKTESIENKRTSVADEIIKYKKLLDDGAITQEEYQNKKKELLNK